MAADNDTTTDTGGGAYLQGDAAIGKDLIGRDHRETKDTSQAAGGGAAVNIRFGDEEPGRRSRRIWNMDDLYLELSRQLQQTNDRMNEMRLLLARLENETIQLKELRAAFSRLEHQFELLSDEMRVSRGDGGLTIAKATLAGVIILAIIAAYAVWVVSNGI